MTKRGSLLILALLPLLCCCAGNGYREFRGYAQGGEYSVKVNLEGVSGSPAAIGAALDSILTAIDFSLSGYNRESILSKRNAGEDVEPDALFLEVLELSEKYSAATLGAFDVYSAPLFDIWGFGFKGGDFPTDSLVQAALKECRERKTLNFNAIAQGYSCDVIARYLHSIGVKDMLVNIGEIYCEGLNPSGRPWMVGVDSPEDGNDRAGARLRGVWNSEGKACGIVTSGNYRKFYIKDGKKYAHTIDPRTGYPVEHGLLSATVVAPTAAEADACATACMVMGPESAKAFIESSGQLEGYLITAEGSWHSAGFPLSE